MPYPKEAQRKGGQAGRKHSVYALRDRGEAAMTPDQVQTLRAIEQQLTTPEGIQEALLQRVAMATAIMGTLEAYIGSQVEAGVPLDSITILRSWPSFQNSCVRALMHLRSMMPKQQADSYAEALERINRVIDEHEKDKADTQRGESQVGE